MTEPTTALTVNDRAPDQVKRLGEIMNAKMSALIDVAPAAMAKYMDPCGSPRWRCTLTKPTRL